MLTTGTGSLGAREGQVLPDNAARHAHRAAISEGEGAAGEQRPLETPGEGPSEQGQRCHCPAAKTGGAKG